MDELYYLYAITWEHGSLPEPTAGVDPRFAVECVPCGRVAGLASRVGWDENDLRKLQPESTDVAWLSAVAVRHNEIAAALASRWPLLPLRLGTLFRSRHSLQHKLAAREAAVAEFLRELGDRREWAVKVFLDETRAEASLPRGLSQFSSSRGRSQFSPRPCFARCTKWDGPPPNSVAAGKGTQYLTGRQLQDRRRHAVQAAVGEELLALEACLRGQADAWRRLRELPAALTNRAERMIWNGAFLLAAARRRQFQGECDRLRGELDPSGLLLELSGPWPPYHFCPALDQRDEG
jgi:hypothetical protein